MLCAPALAIFHSQEGPHGLFHPHLSLLLSGGHAAPLLPGAPEGAQCRPAAGVPLFLLLGGAELYRHHAPLHRGGLYPRPAGGALQGEGKPERRQAGRGLLHGLQPGHPVLLQVLRLRGGEPAGGGGGPPAGAGHPSAHRHQLLHLPDHELHHRCLPGGRPGPAEHPEFRHLRDPLPPAGGGAHHQV